MIPARSISFGLALMGCIAKMATGQMSPTQTVQAALDAFGRSDWRALASLVHPDALTGFRTDQLGSAVGYSLLRSDPQMRHRNISIRPADFVSADAIQRAKDIRIVEFPGKPTVGELAGPALGTGQQVNIAQLSGKVVIVYYWASWNQQCAADFFKLKTLVNGYGSKGLEVVCVNLDNNPSDALGYLQRTLELQSKRTAAIQAQMDHLDAKVRGRS